MARPLKVFMRGKSVTVLQEVLRLRGYPIHDQKGLFGTDTREAVKSFQKQHGLATTGVVDDKLMLLMQQGSVQEPPPSAPEKSVAVKTIKQDKWDALVRLLVKKGVLEEGELEAEMKKVIPTSLS